MSNYSWIVWTNHEWMDNDYDGGTGMSTHTFPIRGLEPINCEPWCEASDGHPDQRLPEDQCCVGPEHRVALLQEPTEHFGEASTEQQYLNTYLMRPADDPAPRVFIGYNEAPGRPATVDEARRFALQILALVDELEASPGEVSPRLHAEPIEQQRALRL